MAEGNVVTPQHPWPWLEPFTELASQFFNGRDEEALGLLQNVEALPASVLFGKSGLGKTSLVLAGLFPLLRSHCLLPVLVRLEHRQGARDVSAQLLNELVSCRNSNLHVSCIDSGTLTAGGSDAPDACGCDV